MVNRLALALLVALAATGPAAAVSEAERKFAIETLDRLQVESFARHREFCGFMGYTDQGKLTVGPISQGTVDSCLPIMPKGVKVVASFHTHGGFTASHWSEIPSIQDVDSDAAAQTNGWVCGIGCVTQDPDFRPNIPGPVRRFYTYGALAEQLGLR